MIQNNWRYVKKDANRFEFKLRVSVVTVFELYGDWSDKKWRIGLFNFAIGN